MKSVRTKFKRIHAPQIINPPGGAALKQEPVVIKSIGNGKIAIDMALVRDVLGLIRLQCGKDNVRGVLALVGAIRVLHEQSGNLQLELTADEIKNTFLMCEIERGSVQ